MRESQGRKATRILKPSGMPFAAFMTMIWILFIWELETFDNIYKLVSSSQVVQGVKGKETLL